VFRAVVVMVGVSMEAMLMIRMMDVMVVRGCWGDGDGCDPRGVGGCDVVAMVMGMLMAVFVTVIESVFIVLWMVGMALRWFSMRGLTRSRLGAQDGYEIIIDDPK
jgi:hypothetical protein